MIAAGPRAAAQGPGRYPRARHPWRLALITAAVADRPAPGRAAGRAL